MTFIVTSSVHLLSLLLLSIAWSQDCLAAAVDQPRQSARDAVETGLTAAVVFEGESTTTGTLEERMQRYRVPAVSVAVIDGYRLQWAAAFGYRERGLSATPQTVFQAASLSKPVAAAVALLLVKDGMLILDSSVTEQLCEWTLPFNKGLRPQAVTLRNLLSHHGGINVHGFSGYGEGEPLPSAKQILNGLPPANSPEIRLVNEPGSVFDYSGGGYQIVEQLVREASGQPFDAVASERLLRPLAMRHSRFSAEPPEQLRNDLAVGHAHDGQVLSGGWRRHPELAAAGLWSTPSDLSRFLVALMSDAKGTSEAALPMELVQLMTSEASESMGLGFGVHGSGDDRMIDHWGETAGYRSYFLAFPERGQGVVIMTNGSGGKELILEVVRGLAKYYDWPNISSTHATAEPLSSEALDAFTGAYEMLEYGFTLTLRRSGNSLVAETPRGSSFTFRAISPTRFLAIEDGSELSFDAAAPQQLQLWGMRGKRHLVTRPESD